MANILLLDDNEDVRDVLAAALQAAGHQVVAVADGTHLTPALSQHAIDLVITDMVMPNRDGVETIMALGKSHPGMPVIAISGDAPAHAKIYLKIAENLGAVKTLQKPFTLAQLQTAVTESLAK